MKQHDTQFLRDHAYGIKWGDYDMPHYARCTDSVILYIKERQRQLQRELSILEKEDKEKRARQEAAPIPVPIRLQLWEPCERCGSEPSYITFSGHLCKNCIGDQAK